MTFKRGHFRTENALFFCAEIFRIFRDFYSHILYNVAHGVYFLKNIKFAERK